MLLEPIWTEGNHSMVETPCVFKSCKNKLQIAVRSDGTDIQNKVDSALQYENWLQIINGGHILYVCKECRHKILKCLKEG
jgi:hypothetical protein